MTDPAEPIAAAPPSAPPATSMAGVLTEWEATLDPAVRQAAAGQVRRFFSDQQECFRGGSGAGGSIRAAEKTSDAVRDAVVAFALYYQDHLRARRDEPDAPAGRPAAATTAGATPPTPRPAPASAPSRATAAAPSDGDSNRYASLWTRWVPLLGRSENADLLAAFVKAGIDGPRKQTWTLLALLRVYFEMDWSAAGDLLEELAHRAGEIICGLIMAGPEAEANKLMAMGCRLLNSHPTFAQSFECRALPARGGFDRNLCESPEGGRGGSVTVVPLSFLVVRKQTAQPSRRARVRWA